MRAQRTPLRLTFSPTRLCHVVYASFIAVPVRHRPIGPAVSEFIPGFEVSLWNGLGAPRNTPPEIIDRLNTQINAGLADPKLKARLADLGGAVLAGSPADFGKLIADETEKWAKVIRAGNIKPE
jgi:tripartite-type tricarboxylate transporter receptor subunit TctC